MATAALVQARAALEAAQSRIGEARGRQEQSAPVNQAIAVAQANAKLAHARQKSAAAALDRSSLRRGLLCLHPGAACTRIYTGRT